MKRLLAASALALSLLAGSQQTASAWCSFKFGIGLNIECQSGNNCLLWGAWSNGPGPGAYNGLAVMPPPVFVPGPTDYPTGPVVTPVPSDFHAPAPTPTHSSPTPSYNVPHVAPLASGTSYPAYAPYAPYAPTVTAYPASYYPMNYPASYYPMSYSYYGNYGYYSFGQ